MKIIITESQLNNAQSKYMKHILGNLREYESDRYKKSRVWKNDDYDYALALTKSGLLYVNEDIWDDFEIFFSFSHYQTKEALKNFFEPYLDLKNITVLYGL
jgi:hypothetical protein